MLDAPPAPRLEAGSDAARALQALEAGRNDLQASAMRIAPAMGDALAALAQLDGVRLVRMSGSGATCFALFDDRHAAARAARALCAAHPGWWVHATSLSVAVKIGSEVPVVSGGVTVAAKVASLAIRRQKWRASVGRRAASRRNVGELRRTPLRRQSRATVRDFERRARLCRRADGAV